MSARRPFAALALACAASCGGGLEDAPNVRSTRGSTIVFLGDSLTRGAGVGRGQEFVALLEPTLPLQLVNAGVGGDTTAGALRRFDDDVAAQDPAVVVVLLGGNDMLQRQPRDAARANLLAITQKILAIGAVPVLVGIELGLFGSGYGGFVEEVAAETGAVYLDGIVDDVLRDPALKVDTIHPNPEGHRRIAERLREPLEALAGVILRNQRAGE